MDHLRVFHDVARALTARLELEEILPLSAKTGYGVKELWARIETASQLDS